MSFCDLSCLRSQTLYKKKLLQYQVKTEAFYNGERVGIRTRDPLIKSQMLYQLSYGIIRANPELSVLVVQMYRKFLFCQNKTIFLYGILIIVNLKTR